MSKRITLSWRGALSNTSQYGEWYGNKKTAEGLFHAQITMNPKGKYSWEVSRDGITVGTGNETVGSGGLPAAKESISILLTDKYL